MNYWPDQLTQYCAFAITIGVLGWVVYKRDKGWDDWVAIAIGGILYSFAFEAFAVKTGCYDYAYLFAGDVHPCTKEWCAHPKFVQHVRHLAGVTLWVPVGWGAIVFATRSATEHMRLSWSRPLMAALLALLLDIALDPLAVELDFWVWCTPDGFYDVCWNNFNGWLLIVACYGFAIDFTKKWIGNKYLRWIVAPLIAFPLCILAHIVFQGLPTEHIRTKYVRLGMLLLLLAGYLGCVIIDYTSPKRAAATSASGAATSASAAPPVPVEVLAVPVLYFALFTSLAFLASKQVETRIWIPALGFLTYLLYARFR